MGTLKITPNNFNSILMHLLQPSVALVDCLNPIYDELWLLIIMLVHKLQFGNKSILVLYILEHRYACLYLLSHILRGAT